MAQRYHAQPKCEVCGQFIANKDFQEERVIVTDSQRYHDEPPEHEFYHSLCYDSLYPSLAQEQA